jgi:hypothetical protein
LVAGLVALAAIVLVAVIVAATSGKDDGPTTTSGPTDTSTPTDTPTPTPTPTPSASTTSTATTIQSALHQTFPATTNMRWNCEPETSSGPGVRYAEHCVLKRNHAVYAFFHAYQSLAAMRAARQKLVTDGTALGVDVHPMSTWHITSHQSDGGTLLQFPNFVKGSLRKLGDYTYDGFYNGKPYSFTLMGPDSKTVANIFHTAEPFEIVGPKEAPWPPR